mgnify:CR=1 FL=1
MKKTYLILMIFASMFTFWACEDTVDVEPEMSKKRSTVQSPPTLNSDGILVFKDKRHVENIIRQLEIQQRSLENYYGAEFDDDCLKQDRLLDLFEDNLGFTSLRTHDLLVECTELEEGVDVDDLTPTIVQDDVVATILNKYREVIIGNEIYVFRANNLMMKASVADIREVVQLRNGLEGVDLGKFTFEGSSKTPTGMRGGEGNPEGGECRADFQVEVNRAQNTVHVTWTGSVSPTQSVTYDWGDNSPAQTFSTTSANVHATHSYPTSGLYIIKATVSDATPGSTCTSNKTYTIDLTPFCTVLFRSNVAPGGIVSFQPHSLVLSNGATKTQWEWDFGDGNTKIVTGQNGAVSHTYGCEGTYKVILKLITSDQNCTPQISNDVKVDNVICFDSDYKYTSGTRFEYDPGNFGIKYYTWLSNWLDFTQPLKCDRVKAKMKHYRIKSNGRWIRNRKPLKIVLSKLVHGAGATGCAGEYPKPLGHTDSRIGNRILAVQKMNEIIGAKRKHPYQVDYYVNGVLVVTKTSDDAGC